MNITANLLTNGKRALAAAVLVAGLMTAYVVWQIESRASILRSGADILLRTAPVDPRDLLRGDYVILSYDISRIPAHLLQADSGKSGWGSVWVRLKADKEGYWNAVEASFEPLTAQDATVVIRSLPFDRFDPAHEVRSYFLQYGIERFYVPEGEGRALEQARNSARVSVQAKVSAAGAMQIRSLLVDGKPVYDEPLY